MLNSELKPATSERLPRCWALRAQLAAQDAFIPAAPEVDNGDEASYADKSGTYTKGILQSGIGLVDLAAYDSFKKALASGSPADFAKITLGGPRTLNGPQGGLAFYLNCPDAAAFGVPPAPRVASEEYATELIELYWASLLRDVAFTDYAANPIAQQAAAELSGLPAYAGPRNAANQVTPELLFRGGVVTTKMFFGEEMGPYLSQFLLLPNALGALPVEQKYGTNKSHADFMLDPGEFLKVQNGKPTGKSLTPVAPLYLHDGRGLAAYTHVDVLYQAYLIAYLVLNAGATNNGGVAWKLNPGNPYTGSHPAAKTQNGFASLGQPDIAAALTAVAGEALKAVWYQKWWVHLRHRPESGGALVHLQKTGQGGSIEAHVSNTVLNSPAVAASHAANGNSYLLSQAFPEGSPTHPAYPTGHGAVAGACITVLKFFFDGDQKFEKPQVPMSNGTALIDYVAPPGEKPLTVNGELHKLAHNISFGHGTHAGIHWRSDTDTSIELGEAVALSFLRNRVRSYNERFSLTLTKLDGTKETFSNP